MARCRCTTEMCTCQVLGTGSVTVVGGGSVASPFVVSMPRIDTSPTGDTGDALIMDADGVFRPAAVSVTPGSINTGVGLTGNGSAIDPLEVRLCSYGALKALCA